ncbi:MAG: HD domain-containing protein [Rhodocyclaceae bacterium]|nr:HD domain-containing protein [Rhodocyclaceae bacterium]
MNAEQTITLPDAAPAPPETAHPPSVAELRRENHAAYQQMYRTMEDLQSLVGHYRTAVADLTRSQHESLVRLAHAAEFKDGDTGAHMIRIGHLAAIVGARAGLDKATCDLLRRAAPMHDLGKIGIPDAILNKAGPLTPEEWVEMRRHPEIGARLIGDSKALLFRMAAEIALCHHERWDGAGYPRGLAGTQIPKVARIVAAVDAIDAMCMDRRYRRAMSADVVRDYLVDNAGNRFDPAVVIACLETWDELMAERDRIDRQHAGSPQLYLRVEDFDPR